MLVGPSFRVLGFCLGTRTLGDKTKLCPPAVTPDRTQNASRQGCEEERRLDKGGASGQHGATPGQVVHGAL